MSEKALAWQKRFDGIVERIVSAETGGPSARLESNRLRHFYSLAQDAACEAWCEEISDDAWLRAACRRATLLAST